ncbi:OmpA family protein [Moritella viscosa]|uniref:Outer membrane protein n=1 Tax=Moritella viscosa TaxID=80854 RepID=A0ABY1HCW2_9GAMM|nr:OmpA family protein [Moritella viscosa]CED61994.1 outer membrane protein [Moritella viscosa]SGY91763.1 Outer membrane protein [Moritella viscosa]SGY96089.1 Outer membrane protein [Moritella viscosa]SGY96488.1 Outer membrane protein [Moritella viscosa]SGZ02043.1 Outer membrane protein [Moritella viscosa]
MMKKTITAVMIVAALSGCARQNATTGEDETNTATKSAIGGAIAGALIGAATGKKNAAIYGAVGGAAIGGGIGYYFDRQEEELRQELTGSGVQVKRVGENELQLIMAKGIGFKTAGYNLSGDIHSSLNSVAKILNEYPKSSLRIVGHTDSIGSAESNLTLSEERAESVSEYLNKRGIKSGRLSTRGYGERRPIASNMTKDGRAANRRVEITITAN